jgi:DNA-binding NtrC family response regulator
MSQQTFVPPKSVLVIDEDQNLRHSLEMILERAGYQVGTVGQAYEALELLRTDTYNLIILDFTSPENRLTLLPAVLRLYPKLAVLVFTAQWSPETAMEIRHLGVQAHLEKPITPDSLLERVDAILRRNPDTA